MMNSMMSSSKISAYPDMEASMKLFYKDKSYHDGRTFFKEESEAWQNLIAFLHRYRMKFRNKHLFYSLPNVQSNLLFLRNFPDLISVDIQNELTRRTLQLKVSPTDKKFNSELPFVHSLNFYYIYRIF